MLRSPEATTRPRGRLQGRVIGPVAPPLPGSPGTPIVGPMARTSKDVEAYLLRSNRKFSAVEDQAGTFLVTSAGATPIVVRVDAPLVVCRVHIGDTGASTNQEALFRRLLQLNAKTLVHASYGLEGDRIVLGAALELENLDYNELQAALDEVDMAVVQQVPELAKLTKA